MTQDVGNVYRFFITMTAPADITVGEWQDHMQGLSTAITNFVDEGDWNHVQRFGPETAGFSTPSVCYTIPATMTRIAEMAEFVIQNYKWFRIPLDMYRTELFDPAEKE